MSDHGNATVAQLLVEAGANVDIPNSVCTQADLSACFISSACIIDIL